MTHPERLDGLYQLLPPIYRDRDAEQDYPLRDLLRVVGEQVLAVENDVAQLYDNWFIETCADWVVPYLGDLLGYQAVREAGEASAAGALGRALTPRREVANTVRFRRRKGTLAVLEELSRAIAGWPARAAEHEPARRLLDVRDAAALDLLGTPFDAQAHLIDVRRPGSALSPGRVNPLDVLLSVWRLQAFSVTRTRAYRVHGAAGCFRFSYLGNDTPLFTKPAAEDDPQHLAGEIHVPGPIRRRALRERVDGPAGKLTWAAPEAYYGAGKSLAIYAPNWPHAGAAQPVPRELILSTDLHCWPEPPAGRLYVDPVRGRVRFQCDGAPPHIQVSYHYGQPAPLGGGEYPRDVSEPAGAVFYLVGKGKKLNDALAAWESEKPKHAVIEITDSGYYSAVINVKIPAGRSLQIRAASEARPVLDLDGTDENAPDAFVFSGEPNSRITLDGLLVVGCAVRISGPQDDDAQSASPCPFEVVIRHCTLVPGWSFDHKCHDTDDGPCDCAMSACEKASLELFHVDGRVTIEHSILGTIRVEQDAVGTDPLPIEIRDSIVDCAHEGDEPGEEEETAYESHHAIYSRECSHLAHAALRLARCTIFGWVKTHAIVTADDCIFTDRVVVARRQLGCMRFCSVPPDSRTPRRYQCQPDRALRTLEAASTTPPTSADLERERQRVVPQWMTRRFGQPDYARLAPTCAPEIARGAEDESEMGVFHDLYEPQRADNLRARLAEFVPADTEAGIFFVT